MAGSMGAPQWRRKTDWLAVDRHPLGSLLPLVHLAPRWFQRVCKGKEGRVLTTENPTPELTPPLKHTCVSERGHTRLHPGDPRYRCKETRLRTPPAVWEVSEFCEQKTTHGNKSPH